MDEVKRALPATGELSPHQGTIADDLLDGAEQIAKFMGWTKRRVFLLSERGEIPTFKFGGRLYARKTTLLARVAELEAKSIKRD